MPPHGYGPARNGQQNKVVLVQQKELKRCYCYIFAVVSLLFMFEKLPKEVVLLFKET